MKVLKHVHLRLNLYLAARCVMTKALVMQQTCGHLSLSASGGKHREALHVTERQEGGLHSSPVPRAPGRRQGSTGSL